MTRIFRVDVYLISLIESLILIRLVFWTAEMSHATSSFWLRLILLLAVFIPSSFGGELNCVFFFYIESVFGPTSVI